MNDTVHIKQPSSCTEEERREFERLVRQGFDGSDEGLPARIRDARWLAFCYPADGSLGAIAAMKAPTEEHRENIFQLADVPFSAADCELELGWVFVDPAHRGNRIGESLSRLLLERVPAAPVFATSRSNNTHMHRILLPLGLARVGRPFPRRNEELVLFFRPAQSPPTAPARTPSRASAA